MDTTSLVVFLIVRVAIGIFGSLYGMYAFHVGIRRFSQLKWEAKVSWLMTTAMLPLSIGWSISMVLLMLPNCPVTLYIDWLFIIATACTLLIFGSSGITTSKTNLKPQPTT